MKVQKLLGAILLFCSVVSQDLAGNKRAWQRIDADGLFTFTLPPGFSKTNMAGVEHYLGEYYKGPTRFLFIWRDTDSNAYDIRREPDMLDYRESETTIGGKRANIRTYSQRRDNQLVYRAELNIGNWEAGDVDLYMEVEAQSASEVAIASKIFTSVRFARATVQADTVRSSDQPAKLFAYDSSRPLDLKELSQQNRDGVIIRDIEYSAYSEKRGRVKAFLVSPAREGSFAGVLFFHWLGRPNGDRTQFLDEAISLAKQGTVSLLIQGYFPWQVDPTDGPADRQLIIDETIEARRALDLLASQPTVDRRRLAYVGHDYGAMYGSLLAGVEKRVKAYVLIAGIGSFTDWSLEYWLKAKPDEFKKHYGESMNGLEPRTTIKRAAPAALLFQFANMDTYITRDAALTFYRGASRPKQIKWYHTTHEMNIETARTDRRTWLTQQLKLSKATS